MKYIIFLLVFTCTGGSYVASTDVEQIDSARTILWGPGLEPERITMRARYFFLQLRDADGRNLTMSPGPDVVKAHVQGQSGDGHPCHVWLQILDCTDGSFIVRYKLHSTCFNLRFSIKVNNENVPQSPFQFKGPIYEEECYCPIPVKNWLEQYECPNNYRQIQEDLAAFSNVDFEKIRPAIIKKYNQPNSVSICHFVIKGNKIYRKCYGQHVGFKIFVDAILLSVTRKVILPDIEFFMNLGDWPLVKNDGSLYPIFSWCGSTDTKDIIMPTYDLTESSLEAMGRVMLDVLSVQGNVKVPWERKIEKLFWRGRDSRRERLDLVDMSRKYPDLFNVSITNFFFFKDEMEKYGPGQRHISFFEFFKYKYQLNIDGTVAAYRFPYLLAGGSLVLKQDSPYYEFFYKDVKPNVHYLPVKRDLSDLVEKIMWAKSHDDVSLKIAKSAKQFARDNLLPQNIFCYHVALFYEWSKRLRNKVKVLDDMEEVVQPNHVCKCHANYEGLKDEL